VHTLITVRHTILATKKSVLDSSGLTIVSSMESGFPTACFSRESPDGSEGSDATEPHLAGLCGLHGEGLSHDGAATSNGLQIGHAATTWRGLAGRGGEGAQSGWGSLLQEWAHGLRLTKNSVHDGQIESISRLVLVLLVMYPVDRKFWELLQNGGWAVGLRFCMSSTSVGGDVSLSFVGWSSASYQAPASPNHNFQRDPCDWPMTGLNKHTTLHRVDASPAYGLVMTGYWLCLLRK
jgi:hypothetical protein